ncbi:MAG: hypothetical protein ABL888_04505 [Pirellulaceae bacterium]
MNAKMFLAIWFTILFICPQVTQADGNISVSVRRGNLRINGSRANDQWVMITPTTVPNRYMLAVNVGTTLNGVNPLFVDGVTGDIDIRMTSLNSKVIVSDGDFMWITVNGNLNITTSSRDSSAIFLDTVICNENISISTGNGPNTVIASNCASQGNFDARLGGSSDLFYAIQCRGFSFSVNGGSGDDFLYLGECRAEMDIEMRGGSGNDLFGLEFPYLNPTELDGGSGNDQYLSPSGLPNLETRRMEGEFPGAVDDWITLALFSNETFFPNFILWDILRLSR